VLWGGGGRAKYKATETSVWRHGLITAQKLWKGLTPPQITIDISCRTNDVRSRKESSVYTPREVVTVAGKVKNIKLFLCFTKQHSIKPYGASGGMAPRILNVDTR